MQYCILRRPRPVARSPRVLDVSLKFGLPPQNQPLRLIDRLPLTIQPGSITLLTGPSGSGKTALLQAIAEAETSSRFVHDVRFPRARAIVDAVAVRRPLAEALSILTACALGEPRLWIRDYRDLSDGEQFRARLARAIGLHLGRGATGPLLGDEFCALLHRRAAKAIAHNIRKLVRRTGLTLVVAATFCPITWDARRISTPTMSPFRLHSTVIPGETSTDRATSPSAETKRPGGGGRQPADRPEGGGGLLALSGD